MRVRQLLLILFFLSGWSAAGADGGITVLSRTADEAAPAASIDDIAWLAGRWVGEGLGGAAEDLIAPASGGQMMGMFRHSKADGSINFYEFYVIAENDGSLTLRLKHFSPVLGGWEEKDEFVEFPLVAIEENAAYFDGLSYRLDEVDSLTVGVRIETDRIAVFEYRRAD